MTKRCRTCGTEKPLDQFRRKSASPDGRQGDCKPCGNAKLDIWRARAREKRLAYNRDYYGSERGQSVIRAYKRRRPTQRKAQSLVWAALYSGRLTKPEHCEKCGSHKRIDGHHDDYAKPLDVRWLCRNCHKAWHREHGEGLNAEARV